jgi:tetratricopeptide (TPR) repeat protein
VPAKQIPADLEDRSALMRTLLAGRRVLLVLDNAADEDQVRPLLPGTRSCRVLITSRRRLAGLDEASLMSLSALPPAQAAELFVRAAAQHGRTAPPAPAVAELVALCGRLPLAIRIAAARLGAHPSWNAGDFLARLRDHEQRLAELTVGQRGIIAALDLSGRHLTVGQLRLYRLLGLHPGPEIDAYAAAALAGITPEKARTILDDLCQVHLLVESRPGRYRFHDLIRVHASQACAEHEPDTARHAARTRLFDHYAQMVSACTEVLYPGEGPHASYITAVGPPLLVPASKAEAVAWIDSELGNLLAVAGHAARHGWPRHAIHLSVTLFHHLAGVRGYLRSAEILHQHALSAARATGDRIGLLRVLVCLGDVHRLAGRWQSAIANLEQAAALAREVGDQAAEQFALLGLGYACFFQGQPGRAARYHKQAMNVARAIGNRAGEIEPLLGLGLVRTQLGECDQASRSLTRALVVAIQTGNRIGQLRSLCGLGILHTIEGRYDDALGRYGQALILARETGDRMAEIYARYGHGHVNRLLGRPGPAAEELERTLAIARETGDPMGQAMALCALGHLHRAAGRLDMALSVHQRAVGLAHGTFVQVRAHYGLGHAYHARGQRDDARRQWQQALKLLTSLGIANDTEVSADDIRAALGTGQRAR